MPTTGNHNIDYDDYFSGYRVSFIPDGSMCVRPCLVDWDDQQHFVQDMLGYSVRQGNSIVRSLPDRHPEYDWLYAVDAEVANGIGAPAQDSGASDMIRFVDKPGSSTSGKAIINVTYKHLDFDVKTDEEAAAHADGELSRYVSRTRTYATEALQIPGSTFKFVSDNVVIQQPWTKRTYTMELSYAWHQVPAVNESKIADCLGCVNSNAFDSGKYAVKTLLFVAPDIRRTRAASGDIAYEITYKFLFRPNGWNSFYRASVFDYAAVIGTDGITYPYDSVNFLELFQLT